jgi:hypothetical protein
VNSFFAQIDWIFDFVLQFLGSDRFDAAVMDFVDENCHIFENDEENKFIYTDIYHEFLDHVCVQSRADKRRAAHAI